MPDLSNGIIIGAGFSGLAAAYWFREYSSKTPLMLLEKEEHPLSWLDRKGVGAIAAGDAANPGSLVEGRYVRGVPGLSRMLDSWAGSMNLDWLRSLGFVLEQDETGTAFFLPEKGLRESWCELLEKKQVKILTNYAVEVITRQSGGGYRLWSREGNPLDAGGLLFATGGERNHGLNLARELGHEINPVEAGFLRLRLASPRIGTTMGPIERIVGLKCLKTGQATNGLISLSGRGLEGPVVSSLGVLAASAWRQVDFRLKVEIDWLPTVAPGQVMRDLLSKSGQGGRRLVGEDAHFGFNPRQWRCLLKQAKVDPSTTWGKVKQRKLQALAQQVKGSVVSVSGAGLPHGERAWAGGIHPDSVDWSSCRSSQYENIWFAGEVLDYLGMPGGAHLNALWASACRAGSDMGNWFNKAEA